MVPAVGPPSAEYNAPPSTKSRHLPIQSCTSEDLKAFKSYLTWTSSLMCSVRQFRSRKYFKVFLYSSKISSIDELATISLSGFLNTVPVAGSFPLFNVISRTFSILSQGPFAAKSHFPGIDASIQPSGHQSTRSSSATPISLKIFINALSL